MKSETRLKKIRNLSVILWRYIAVFIVVILGLVAVVSYIVMGSAFLNQARDRVNEIGRELTMFMGDPENSENDAVVRRLNEVNYTGGVNVFVISPEGEIVYPVGGEPPESWNGVVEKITGAISVLDQGAKTVFFADGFQNYAASVNFQSTPHYLLVRYSVAVLSRSVGQMQMYILIIVVVAIALAFLISYIIAQRLSKPLRNLSLTATQLAKGNYGVNFDSVDYQEIAQLSETLNTVKDEVKKSDDFQKELLANVSHDLKTPLTMIKAYASMVKEISGDDPEKREKHLQVIIDESDRLTGLVNDVLKTSKITSGLEQLNKKVFNLTEFVYGVLNKFEYLQETQGYTIMVDIDPNLYTLADEEKIGQVIYNLFSNAVNYTGEDKTIYVSLKDNPQENRIKFSVRDTGKGISEEELQHIWDRYYRSKDAHTRPVKGTGLGLNIVKYILQSHSFDFGVKSEVGKGSVFTVDFPCVPATPEQE